MRKLILLAVTMFIVVGGAAFTVNWFSRASAAKSDIERIVADLNKRFPTFSYESISTSGFPRSLTVSIVKPHFSGDMPDEFMKRLRPPYGEQTLPVWHSDILLDGTLEISVNTFSNQYMLVTRGDWKIDYKAGEQLFSSRSQSVADGICELSVDQSASIISAMWNFEALAPNPQTFFQNFRSLNCVSQGFTTYNPKNEVLGSSGPIRFYISNTPSGAATAARLYVQAKDSELTEVFDKEYSAFAKLFAIPFVPYAQYGKQNMEIDLSYKGAKDWGSEEAKNIPLDFTIDKFDISNAAYNSNFSSHITHALSGANRTGSLTFKSEYTPLYAYTAILHNILQQVVDIIKNTPQQGQEQGQKSLSSYSEEELNALFSALTPDLLSLGKMVLSFDGTYAGAADFSSGEAKLNHAEISATPYGITASGNIKKESTQLFPAATATINCSNCLSMIDDAAAYANRIDAALRKINPDAAKVGAGAIDPKHVSGAKEFLSALNAASATPDKTNLTFSITSDGAGNFSVNGKNMAEVLTLYNRYFPASTETKVTPPRAGE